MKTEIIVQLHSRFEQCMKIETEGGTEFWLARDLQTLLGYDRWENFSKVIGKATTACVNSGYDVGDHFLETTKMVDVGSGAQREIEDFMLTRYACYLIAQNGDANKEPIAFAQTYFAVQTRKMDLIEQRLDEMERLNARKKLTESERQLSGIIFERLRENQSFARIRSKGDQALFGGQTTQDMKHRLAVPKSRPLADHQGQGFRQRNYELQHQERRPAHRGDDHQGTRQEQPGRAKGAHGPRHRAGEAPACRRHQEDRTTGADRAEKAPKAR